MSDLMKLFVSSSAKLRILLISICLTLVISKFDSKLRDERIFISKEELQNREVLGMAKGYGLLAVATLNRIVFYTDDDERKKFGQVTLTYKERKFLELKMFSKSEMFYCDEETCGLCTYSQNNSSCSSISLHEENIRRIRSAAVVKISNMQEYMLSLSYYGDEDRLRMKTLRYLADDNGVHKPLAYTTEADFKMEPSSLIGFEKGNYVYFIVSTTQASEPEAVLQNTYINVTVTKVMRFCSGDQTPDLASQISILVGCDGETRHFKGLGEAAIYYDKTEQLDVVMLNPIGKNRFICRFKMNAIEKRFNNVWDTCQTTPYKESEQKRQMCMFPPSYEEMSKKKGCMTFTKIESEQTTFCMRFGRDEPLDNCRLHETKSASYQFGWLEDYNVLQGELMMKIPSDSSINNVRSMVNDGKSYFALVQNSRNLSELLRISASNNTEYQLNWFTQTVNSGKTSVALLKPDLLLFSSVDGLEKVIITCPELYRTCSDLQKGGWTDPLECAWCADTPVFHTISGNQKDKCGSYFVDQCPPEVKDVHKYSNNSGFTIYGSKFEILREANIDACDTLCTVTEQDTSFIRCDVGEVNRISSDCDSVKINGKIGEKMYSLPYSYIRSDSEQQTERITADEKKNSSPSWKVALAVLAVFLLIFIVVLIVYFMRNRLPQIKSHVQHTISPRVENDYDLGHMGGRSAQLFTGDSYVRVFRELDPRMKIDYKQLTINRNVVLGRGHYGVVYPAVYTPSKGNHQNVVCKYMKEGRISEFYEEARNMREFNHPQVLKLVGVALDDTTHLPIIITEFMENGDLKSFISDEKNEIKMRDLFQYAIDIAKGMAYIHSKKFIHRDLAARNCMLDENCGVRIADFGLCRKLDEVSRTYTVVHDRELPIRWFPPEIISEGYDDTTDVWSFGIVIWELFTRGSLPYSKISTDMLLPWLAENERNRLDKPPYCPDKLYTDAMLACWRSDPLLRPSFESLIEIIQNVVKFMEGYDRSQFDAGYERVSNRSRTSLLLDQVYLRTNSSTRGSVTRPLLANQRRAESSSTYSNVDSPNLPSSSIDNGEYLFLSDCSEHKPSFD